MSEIIDRIERKYELTDELAREVGRLHARRIHGIKFVLSMVLVGAFVLGAILGLLDWLVRRNEPSLDVVYACSVAAGFCSVFAVLSLLGQRALMRVQLRALRDVPHRNAAIIIHADGLVYQNPLGEHDLAWSAVRRLVMYRRVVEIEAKTGLKLYIPQGVVDQQVWVAVSRAIAASAGAPVAKPVSKAVPLRPDRCEQAEDGFAIGYELDDKMLAVFSAFLMRLRLPLVLVIMGLVLLFGIGLAALSDLAISHIALLVMIILIAVGWGVRKGLAQFSKSITALPHRHHVVRLTSSGIAFENAAGRSQFEWARLPRLRPMGKVWLLYFSPRRYFFLPRQAFSDEALAFLQQKVREAGGRIG